MDRLVKITIVIIVVWSSIVGCSVLIMNHSHGNEIRDWTDPGTDINARFKMRTQDKEFDEIIEHDSIKENETFTEIGTISEKEIERETEIENNINK